MINAEFGGEDYLVELLDDYKQKMHDVFFPHSLRATFSIKNAKKLISDFKKVGDVITTLDLMLYYVECGTEFTNEYGDIDEQFYDSLCSVFAKFVYQLNSQPDDMAYQKFKTRINSLVHNSSDIGWGYGDYIFSTAFEIEWIEEE